MAGTRPDAAPFTAQDLLGMMTAFKRTAVLRAAVELDVFDALGADGSTAGKVAARVGADVRGTRLLLEALAACDLLVAEPGPDAGDPADAFYRPAPGVADVLLPTGPRYLGGIVGVAASAGEWSALGRLAESVRTGRGVPDVDATGPGVRYWVDFAGNGTLVTTRGAQLVADLVAPRLGHRLAGPEPVRVLDAGCGSAAFGLELAARHPAVQVTGQDWPDVLEVAAAGARALGLGDRFELLPGDVRTADLGGGYDVVIAANLMLLFPPEEARRLVARLRAVLRPGGVLVLLGFMTGSPTANEHVHLLNLLMLSWTPGGEARSVAEYEAWAREAGLVDVVRHEPPGLATQVVLGAVPA